MLIAPVCVGLRMGKLGMMHQGKQAHVFWFAGFDDPATDNIQADIGSVLQLIQIVSDTCG
jgi:hypothetical protein